MPSLNWIGKEAVANHDKEIPFRLLKKVKSVSVGEGSQNLIIHGDNLEALKSLMPHYMGRVQCVFIDPPYNTGNEAWVYNDKVNSPKIKQWLGRVVGRESEDLTRHDKWLCMMHPRLKLLRDLMADNGAIFLVIGDDEMSNSKSLLNEVFGEENFVSTVVWQKVFAKKNKAQFFSGSHDYIHIYAKSILSWKRNLLPRNDADLKSFKNPDNDPRGLWQSVAFTVQSESADRRKNYRYEIKLPGGKTVLPPVGRHWNGLESRYEELRQDNRLWFGKNKDSLPREKSFLSEVQQGVVPDTWWDHGDAGNNQEAKKEILDLFGGIEPFNTPKPLKLLKKVLTIATDKSGLILDSFAGSGTTAHAVLDLNKEDGGNRKFIMVEMEDFVAKDITAERVKRAIKKYDYKDGFEYCELDKTLFDEMGHIEKTCDFNQFATYIYFTETQRNIDKKDIDGNFIGEDVNTEFYLIYKEPKVNDLDKSFIKKLRKTEGKKVVYADRCMLDDETLAQCNIVFKQIPYEVKIY